MKASDREEIYERIAEHGVSHLTDEELISNVVGVRAKGIEVKTILQNNVGGLVCLGLTERRAIALVSAVELGIRCQRPRVRGVRIQSSRDVDALFQPRLAMCMSEQFISLPLDAKNRPIGEIRVTTGGMTTCPVVPSDVFRTLIAEAAHAVIFIHNHPGGEPTPSADDVALTERLRKCGEVIGVRVLDHIIIGQEGFFSFMDAGLLGPRKEDHGK